ncbi:MAG: glycosyltransferase family 39 protein [Phycisphaerae bacterium]
MRILALLPLLAIALGSLAIHARNCKSKNAPDWRDSIFTATVLISLWTALVTEFLGFFRALEFWPVLIAWMIPILVALVFTACTSCRFKKPNLPSLSFLEMFACAMIALVLLVVLVSALIAPPNNIDSLNYHLPRIVAWMQQHSLADFPTDYTMQLAMPGFMEYLGLNSMILGGGSAWAVNLFGTLSLLLLGLAGSSIAKRLGGNRESQFVAMLLIITIPMAFGMASTFKPEIMEAWWVELLAYWLLGILLDRRCNFGQLILVAVTFGLAALTHGTAYVLGVPLAIMAAIGLWRSVRWRSIGYLLLIALMVILINAGYYTRNIVEFGGPFGPSPENHPSLQVLNSEFTPRILLENLLRDTASMAAGPSHILNQALGCVINSTASALRLNLQDPRATQPIPGIASPYDGVAYFPNNEYRTSWPLQIFLIALLPFIVWLEPDKHRAKRCLLFAILPIGCLLAMAAVIRWQQPINHLLVPIPALFMPVAAVAVSGKPFRWFRPLAVIGAVIALLPFAFLYPRTLLGQSAIEWHSRTDLLVREHTVNARTLKKLVEFMSRFDGRPIIIGLSGRTNLPPYAIESALIIALRPRPQFIYFNASIRVPGVRQAAPEWVIANANSSRTKLIRKSTHLRYHKVATLGSLAIYVPAMSTAGNLPVRTGHTAVPSKSLR